MLFVKFGDVIFYFIAVYACFIRISLSQSQCDWFKDVSAEIVTSRGSFMYQPVTSCVGQKFLDHDILAMHFWRQNLTIIGKGSFKNIKNLITITIKRCTTKNIFPGAFQNVPILEEVEISSCKLKEVPNGVFSELPALETLQLHKNKISLIQNDAFINLVSLKTVYADYNELEYWNRDWFRDSKVLDNIDFRSNRIRTIPQRAFAFTPNLRRIYFDYNKIQTIQDDAFEGLTYLEYLGLIHNRLKEINNNGFPPNLQIETFHINENYLTYISIELLKKLSVKEISINYNPWKCSCLDRIYYWIRSSNVSLQKDKGCYKRMNAPVCTIPKVYSQTCIDSIDDELIEMYSTALKYFPKHPTDNRQVFCEGV